ncbi:glutamate 5-kinase [Sporothrix brasiliensis 5110]|uniref:Glutamate 5-kinase n=1 Tax=Sporothrix brasiliensis 5110 TaxID=1398154 RepID=A0A0C2IT20_9PEZI|nr:glutamate 5-kinase [Sporothrix brasiliensis 5110]KIH92186.1 glutamate 5-kinase [Sporothrix brasiliensis 5110]
MKGPRPLGIVIKLGTSSIIDATSHEPLIATLSLIVETAVRLRKDGHRVVIVSSGAIGVGLRRMDVENRPKHLAQLQALAAIGQCRLIGLWDSLFSHLRQPIAQILLTRNDIADRTQYLRAQNTFAELFDMGVIPIVNENDTLAVEEIRFGDNDTLSAITAAMIHADLLFLMTDVDCLYTKNPRQHPDAEPIEVVDDINALEADISTPGSALGTGGMSTKIVAARLATSAGVTTVITRSSTPDNLVQILAHIQTTQGNSLLQKSSSFASMPASAVPSASSMAPSLSGSTTLTKPPLHTRFLPWPEPVRDRSFWILHGLAPHGTVFVDQGAYQALVERAGLLPVGVVDVEGPFSENDAVRIVVVDRKPAASADGTAPAITTPSVVASGTEVGRALVKYSSTEIARIMGHRSRDIQGILGYVTSEYVAQREYISLFRRKDSRPASPSLRDKERDVAHHHQNHHHRVSPNQKAASVAVESPLHKVEGLALNSESSSRDEPSA